MFVEWCGSLYRLRLLSGLDPLMVAFVEGCGSLYRLCLLSGVDHSTDCVC